METVDASSVKKILIKFAIAFLRSAFVSSELFEHIILLHPSVECPDPRFVLMAAFLMISSLMYANMIYCRKLETLLKKALAKVFSCEFCETFESTFFIKHLRWLLLIRTISMRTA